MQELTEVCPAVQRYALPSGVRGSSVSGIQKGSVPLEVLRPRELLELAKSGKLALPKNAEKTLQHLCQKEHEEAQEEITTQRLIDVEDAFRGVDESGR